MCALLSQARTHQLPVLLVGDFNLHHRDWEDKARTNCTVASANEFADFLRKQDWTMLNPLLMPHGITRPNPTSADGYDAVIDLTITDSPRPVHIHGHRVQGCVPLRSLSGHADSGAVHPGDSPSDSHTLTQRTQWNVRWQPEVWQAALPGAMEQALRGWEPLTADPAPSSSAPRPHGGTHEVQARMDEAYTDLENIFIRTCERTIGTHVTSSSTKHWFSYPGIKSAYSHMKRTRRVWKRSRRPCAIKAGAASAAMDAWKLMVRSAKAACWSELCANIQLTPCSKLKWTLFRQSRGRETSSPSSFPDVDGVAPSHIGASLNHLCDHFVTSSVPPPLPAGSADGSEMLDYTNPVFSRTRGTTHCRPMSATTGCSRQPWSKISARSNIPALPRAVTPSCPSSSPTPAQPCTPPCPMSSHTHGATRSCLSSGRKLM